MYPTHWHWHYSILRPGAQDQSGYKRRKNTYVHTTDKWKISESQNWRKLHSDIKMRNIEIQGNFFWSYTRNYASNRLLNLHNAPTLSTNTNDAEDTWRPRNEVATDWIGKHPPPPGARYHICWRTKKETEIIRQRLVAVESSEKVANWSTGDKEPSYVVVGLWLVRWPINIFMTHDRVTIWYMNHLNQK